MVSLYLALNVLVFGGFGVAFTAFPGPLAEALGITLGGPDAMADFRAMYGGLSAGCAVLFAAAMRRAEWREPAVWLAITTAAGLLFGRVVNAVQHGMPGEVILAFAASEVVSIGVGVWLARARR